MSIFQQVYSRDRWEGEGQTEQIGAKTLARINESLIFVSCHQIIHLGVTVIKLFFVCYDMAKKTVVFPVAN
jgi:hypothetical protein